MDTQPEDLAPSSMIMLKSVLRPGEMSHLKWVRGRIRRCQVSLMFIGDDVFLLVSLCTNHPPLRKGFGVAPKRDSPAKKKINKNRFFCNAIL
jgi:hypothetical protein